MFGHERVRSDYPFANVPHEPFPHFHSELIGSGLQVTFHAEIDSGLAPVDVVGSKRTDPTLAVEYPDEGRIVPFWPFFDGEGQRIPIVLRRVAEFQITVHRHPGVVKSKTEKWQLKIKIFMNLRHRPVYVPLIVSLVVIPALIEKPVQELLSDFRQSVFG